jgi:hypothetical protein
MLDPITRSFSHHPHAVYITTIDSSIMTCVVDVELNIYLDSKSIHELNEYKDLMRSTGPSFNQLERMAQTKEKSEQKYTDHPGLWYHRQTEC